MKTSATASGASAPDRRLGEAARAMESMLLKQIVISSGAFKGGEVAGSAFRADVFAQTLADALAQGGGIGLAAMLERSLGSGQAGTRNPKPATTLASARASRLPMGPAGRAPTGVTAASFPVPMSSPIPGARSSSPFGIRADPFTGKAAAHDGLDLSAPGGVPVEASAAGTVVDAGPRGGYGLAVEIDHGHGITTLYGHASQVLVEPGQRVERGEPVALLGDTGRSTGPHLHFEVRSNGSPVDPRRALNAYGSRADNIDGSLPLASPRSP